MRKMCCLRTGKVPRVSNNRTDGRSKRESRWIGTKECMQIYYELSDWFGQSIRQSGGALEGKQRAARRCEFLAVARARSPRFFSHNARRNSGYFPYFRRICYSMLQLPGLTTIRSGMPITPYILVYSGKHTHFFKKLMAHGAAPFERGYDATTPPFPAARSYDTQELAT